ncbi:MAG TPA: MFS transporter, partial [Candidatus Tumulicola sp.]|nr:MFS transporter [Candidatus Tumulicola sp.]
TIPVAAFAHVLGMPQLYAVSLIAGCASAFFGIAYQAYLPVLVEKDRLTDANSKLEFSNSGTSMAGNALAGILIQAIGAAAAIAADAISYLVSVAALIAIRQSEPRHEGPRLSMPQMLHELREGIHVVFGSQDLRWILGATATTNFGGSMTGAVSLLFAYRVLHLQPGPLGIIYGISSIGFVGALLSTRARARFGLRSTLIVALFVGAIAGGSVLFATIGAPYVVLFFSSAIAAICVPIYNVNQVSYRQALVPARLQGRMNATIRTFVWGTVPLGALAGGYAAGVIGIPQTIFAGALIELASVAWLIPLRERAAMTDAVPQSS